MSDFLLVHGAYHGAWCWDKVRPALQALGHRVRAIDLPAHGDDRTPPEAVDLAGYVEAIDGALGDSTVLVAHSAAGVPAAAAAERSPEKIACLVFVAAYVPESTESVLAMRSAAPRYYLTPAVRPDADGIAATLDLDRAADLLYNGCSEEDRSLAAARVCPEPLRPLRESVSLTERYWRVDKAYIRCTRDRVIVPEYQALMAQRWCSPNARVLDSGHSPFFSHAEPLARLLHEVAEQDR